VLLLDAPRRNWRSGETGEFKFVVSRFEDDPSDEASLRWELKSGNETLASGVQERLQVSAGGVQELLAVKLEMPQRAEANRLTLTAELVDPNGRTKNSWTFWVFPTKLLAEAKVRSSGFDALRKVYPWAPEQTPNLAPADTGSPRDDAPRPGQPSTISSRRPASS